MIGGTSETRGSPAPAPDPNATRKDDAQQGIAPGGGPNDATVGTGDIGQLADPPQIDGYTLPPSLPPGTPVLPPPRVHYSAAVLAILIEGLIAQADDAQSQVDQLALQQDDQLQQETFRKAAQKLEEIGQKLHDVTKKMHASDILGIIGKAVGVIAALAAMAATFGAAGPVAIPLIVCASYSLVDSVMSLADTANQANGGTQRLDMNDLLTEAFTWVAKKEGYPDDKAAKIGQDCAIAFQVTVAVVGLGANIYQGVKLAGKEGMEGVGLLAQKLGPKAIKGITYTNIAAQVTTGVVQVTSGSLQISIGHDQEKVSQARADKEDAEAAIALLKDLISKLLDDLQFYQTDQSEGMKSAAQSVSKIGQVNIEASGGGARV